MAVETLLKAMPRYQPKKGEEYMSPRQKAHFRKILEALRQELSQDIDRTVHTMQDEATIFADPNDRATQESDIALELRNRDRAQAHQEDRRDDRQDRLGRVRVLRELRHRDRT